MEDISLYFHIPFCTRKCDYCHFFVLPEKEEAKHKLLEGLKREISLIQPLLRNKRIITVYFGGGTPSLFGPERIKALLDIIKTHFTLLPEAEVTLECNPENISVELINNYKQAGINRVSIGIQTLDENLLHLLGRLHKPETAVKAVFDVVEAGIRNISIDLMFDLPKQTLKHWLNTLEQIKPLPIQHLSLYNLTIEPHTIFFKKQAQLKKWLPDEETSLAMYETAQETLEKRGFNQYEISAFALPGYTSKHNKGYWTGRSFLGLGPSAFSYWEGKRMRNVPHLNHYCEALEKGISPADFEEKLDTEARVRELFVINLRLREGICLEKFKEQHGIMPSEMQIKTGELISKGFLVLSDGNLRLSKTGVLFYDSIAAELI